MHTSDQLERAVVLSLTLCKVALTLSLRCVMIRAGVPTMMSGFSKVTILTDKVHNMNVSISNHTSTTPTHATPIPVAHLWLATLEEVDTSTTLTSLKQHEESSCRITQHYITGHSTRPRVNHALMLAAAC